MARRLISSFVPRLLICSPLRAGIEALGLGLSLLAITWLMRVDIPPGEQQNGLFIALLSAMSWYGIRLQRSTAPWTSRVIFEIAVGLFAALGIGGAIWWSGNALLTGMNRRIEEAGLMAVTSVVLRAIDIIVIRGERLPPGSDYLSWPPTTTVMFLSGTIAFITMRGGVYIWQFWARLRRRHLLWSLTHSHMMLVVLGIFLFAAVTTINSAVVVSTQESHTTTLSFAFSLAAGFIVPLLIIIGFLTVLIVVGVLPPALTLSYFAARRTTRRLQRLTEATTHLRQGNYSTQITVQGEDEVAALQADFNMMAHALDNAMRAVQTERDNVEKLLRNRRELVASVSHELRTPVAILRGHLEAILPRWQTQLPPDLVQDVAVMESETLRLQRLIDDLFTLSRAEVGELAITCQPTALIPVLQRVANAAAPTFWQTYKVELVLDLPDGLPPAQVDEMRVEQILHNLLRNAIRHTPPGGIIALSAHAAAAQIIVQVKDTGVGIASEHLPHIWERFYRATPTEDTPQNRDYAGAGLGLALVKDLTTAMHGTVTVDSVPGQGSTFSVYLPRA